MSVVSMARAFAPAHITGFFVIFQDGSTGAGLNLELGAETGVQIHDSSGPVEVIVNGVDTQALVSHRVAQAFGKSVRGRRVTVSTTTAFPVGYGFGMSGAGSFSFSLALNAALGAGKSYKECMQIAADAEIFCGTGLGTVMTQQYCGFLIGEEPYPSRTARQIECTQDTVVSCFLDPIETSSIIRDGSWKERINAVGQECMIEMNRNPTVKSFIELSRHFTLVTGLASDPVRAIMAEVKVASMAMLGQTLFAVVHHSEAQAVAEKFRRYTENTMITPLGKRAATVL